MTQRGTLSPEDQRKLEEARGAYEVAMRAGDHWKRVVVEMIDKSSYREVARLTGLSTNTLQRWKKEAGR